MPYKTKKVTSLKLDVEQKLTFFDHRKSLVLNQVYEVPNELPRFCRFIVYTKRHLFFFLFIVASLPEYIIFVTPPRDRPVSLSNLGDPTITTSLALEGMDMSGKVCNLYPISSTQNRNLKAKCEKLLILSLDRALSLDLVSLKLHNAIKVQWANYRFINL